MPSSARVASTRLSIVRGPRASIPRKSPMSKSFVSIFPPIMKGRLASTVFLRVTSASSLPIFDVAFPFTARRLRGPLSLPEKFILCPLAMPERSRRVSGARPSTSFSTPLSVNPRFFTSRLKRLFSISSTSMMLPLRFADTPLPSSSKMRLSREKSFTYPLTLPSTLALKLILSIWGPKCAADAIEMTLPFRISADMRIFSVKSS